MGERESTRGMFALGAVGLAFCCGFPLLLAAGAFGTLAGIGLGNWLVVGLGLVVAAVGAGRRTRRRSQSTCDNPNLVTSIRASDE